MSFQPVGVGEWDIDFDLNDQTIAILFVLIPHWAYYSVQLFPMVNEECKQPVDDDRAINQEGESKVCQLVTIEYLAILL